MDFGVRLIGILAAAAMAWLGFWIYRYPDRFLKKMYGEMKFWDNPPVRFMRIFGLLIFGV
jgi:hypothetical protein